MFILQIGPTQGSGNTAPVSGSKPDANKPKDVDTKKVTPGKKDEVVVKSGLERVSEELANLKAELANTKDVKQIENLTKQIKLAEVKLDLYKVIKNPNDEKQMEAFKQKLFKLPADSSLEDLDSLVLIVLNNVNDTKQILKVLDPLEKKFDKVITSQKLADPASANKKIQEGEILSPQKKDPNSARRVRQDLEFWRDVIEESQKSNQEINDLSKGSR